MRAMNNRTGQTSVFREQALPIKWGIIYMSIGIFWDVSESWRCARL